MTTPLHCKVCAKPLYGQQRLYCGRPCKRRAYAAKQKLREAQQLADAVDNSKLVPTAEAICDGKLTYVGEVNTRLSLDFSITRTGDTITISIPPNTATFSYSVTPSTTSSTVGALNDTAWWTTAKHETRG